MYNYHLQNACTATVAPVGVAASPMLCPNSCGADVSLLGACATSKNFTLSAVPALPTQDSNIYPAPTDEQI
ncbi:MAG: hypothetical protein K0U66_04995 [Gammaproteobacteria bacterium]|nr:hypothetical protein [Gammaproteobacteria bacterium]